MRRFGAAAASALGVVVVVTSVVVFFGITGQPAMPSDQIIQGVGMEFFFFFIFGFVPALVVSLLAGMVGIAYARRHGRSVSRRLSWGTGMVVGGVTMPFVWGFGWSGQWLWSGVGGYVVLGAVAGGVGGALFRVVWLWPGPRKTPQ